MHTLLVLCGIAALIAGSSAFKSPKYQKPEQHVTAEWIVNGTFRASVDHFRAQDGRVADFKYHANLNFTNPNGPVFIYLKDAGDYSTRWIESGLIVDLARERNGSVFTFDYRFFGNNRPTENATFENLAFLTIEQILADIAQFVNYITLFHDVYGSDVIVYGAGYGGTLAAWARKKFPHLIDAAWSSSGIYELSVASLSVYDSLSYSIYRTTGENCRDLIRQGFDEAERLINEDNGGNLQQLFNLCNPIDANSTSDVSTFFQLYFDMLVDFVQTQHGQGIHEMCEDIESSSLSPVEALAEWARFALTGDQCFDASYASKIAERSNPAWDQAGTLSGRRQWSYIQCTQAGLFQITDDWTWLPNHVELPFLVGTCQDILGPDYVFDLIRGQLEFLRNQYGSLYMRSSRTIFTSGEVDPKYYNGIIYTSDPQSIAITIPGHGRASDIPSIHPDDTDELREVKEHIVQLLQTITNPLPPPPPLP